jgi:chromatin remodeling complex protein RSC6
MPKNKTLEKNIDTNKIKNQNNVEQEQNISDQDNEPSGKLYLEVLNHFEKSQDEHKLAIIGLKKLYKLLQKNSLKLNKKKNNSQKERLPTGFSKSTHVPLGLKTLLNIDKETITRPELTNKLYEYINTNNLKSENNKRIMRVDDKLEKALELTKEEIEKINSSTSEKDKDGLNFYTIQKWIARLYKKT